MRFFKCNMIIRIIIIFISCIYETQALGRCPGPCVPPKECKSNGGRIIGYCTNDRACCDYINLVWGTCGMTIRNTKVSNFKSPSYPDFSSGSFLCAYDLELSDPTVGIRIDFLDIFMDSVPEDPAESYESQNSICDSDMMFIKGFSDWMPDVRCGNLTDYAILVEREPGQRVLSIVFVMSSSRYKWNLRLTQIYEVEIEQMNEIVTNMVRKSRGSGSGSPKDYHFARPPFPIPVPPPFLTESDNDKSNIATLDDYSNSADGDMDTEIILPTPLIQGGQTAEPNIVPWQVSIQSKREIESALCGDIRNMSLHICGGSIIDDNTILTANHCFLSPSKYPHPVLDVSQLKVVVGAHDLCKPEETYSKTYSISSIILHYNYLSTDIINDLAMVRLTERISFNKGVQPIPVANPDLKLTEVTPILSGWGSIGVDENYTFPHVLQISTDLNILSEEDCTNRQKEYLAYTPWRKLSNKYFGSFHRGICTRGKSDIVQAGYGDSGGPLATNISGNPVLLGVVSHYRPEWDSVTNVSFNLNYFAKVSAFKKWILMGLVPV